jgi:hypothetical protein
MEVIIWLLQAYLLCWVLVGVFGMFAMVYYDVRASARDFMDWIKK